MSRINLATDLKTRTGAPSGKDARLINSYIETRGDQSVVRKRPIAQGGVSVGAGIAQGGINFNGLFLMNGDVLSPYTGGGTNWNSGTNYAIGSMVSVNFVDYWAINSNTNSQPPNSNWSTTYVPPIPSVPHTYTTWDPIRRGANLQLSNFDLTLTGNLGTPPQISSAFSLISKNAGKWYWEITIGSTAQSASDFVGIGIATATTNKDGYIGSAADGWGYYNGAGTSYAINNGVFTAYGSLISTTNIVGVALDMDAGTVKFYLNGLDQGIAFSGLSGNIYAAYSFYDNSPATAFAVTANFGASAFAYSIPSGFNAGLYV